MATNTGSGDGQVPRIRLSEVPMVASRADGWKVIRDAGRVVYAEEGSYYYITRRDDVLAALRDPELFSSEKATAMLGSPLPLVPLAFDPPEHTRYRHILQPFFSPSALKGLLPSLQEQITEIVADIATKGECDVVADLAIPYPSQVFLALFGLPLAERDRLVAWKDAVIALSEKPAEDADITPALELFAFLTEAVNERKRDPGNDVLSQVLTGEQPLSDQEAIGLSFLFVLAGLDTVTSAIGFAMYELARDPGLRRHLRQNDGAIDRFIEEIVRLEGPVPAVPRMTTAPATIGDVTIPAETQVRLCLGAISREDGGDDMRLDGTIRRHWGYGGGPHRCLGMHLARMELRLVVSEWLARIPEFELAPHNDSKIEFPAGTHTLNELWVRFPAPS